MKEMAVLLALMSITKKYPQTYPQAWWIKK